MASSIDYCAIPAGAPPTGHMPNLINPTDLSVVTLSVGISVLGFILSVAYTVVIIIMRKYTRHMWDIPACWYFSPCIWKLLFSSNILLGSTQFVVKVAIIALYMQIFATKLNVRRIIWAAIFFCGLICLPHPILVIVFNAPHIGENWVDLATNGRTEKLRYYAPIHGIGSIIIDIWILVMPLPIISKLNVKKKKKVQLMAVFLTGGLGVMSSVFACYWRFRITLDNPGDKSWQEAQLFIWIMVEQNVAIIVGCMPGFAALLTTDVGGSILLRSIRSKLLGSTGSGASSGSFSRKYSNYASRDVQGNTYSELNDNFPLKTNVTAVNNPDKTYVMNQGILKTTTISAEPVIARGYS